MNKKTCMLILVLLLATVYIKAQTVYVTRSGLKYHNEGCTYLKSKIEIKLADAIEQNTPKITEKESITGSSVVKKEKKQV